MQLFFRIITDIFFKNIIFYVVKFQFQSKPLKFRPKNMNFCQKR